MPCNNLPYNRAIRYQLAIFSWLACTHNSTQNLWQSQGRNLSSTSLSSNRLTSIKTGAHMLFIDTSHIYPPPSLPPQLIRSSSHPLSPLSPRQLYPGNHLLPPHPHQILSRHVRPKHGTLRGWKTHQWDFRSSDSCIITAHRGADPPKSHTQGKAMFGQFPFSPPFYQVCYISQCPSAQNRIVQNYTLGSTYTLGGLSPGITYIICVTASTSEREGPAASVTNTTTYGG